MVYHVIDPSSCFVPSWGVQVALHISTVYEDVRFEKIRFSPLYFHVLPIRPLKTSDDQTRHQKMVPYLIFVFEVCLFCRHCCKYRKIVFPSVFSVGFCRLKPTFLGLFFSGFVKDRPKPETGSFFVSPVPVPGAAAGSLFAAAVPSVVIVVAPTATFHLAEDLNQSPSNVNK